MIALGLRSICTASRGNRKISAGPLVRSKHAGSDLPGRRIVKVGRVLVESFALHDVGPPRCRLRQPLRFVARDFFYKKCSQRLDLGLLASPLVLMLAFTFMSDIQFLGWWLLSLWLYVRGIRYKSAAKHVPRFPCIRVRHRDAAVRHRYYSWACSFLAAVKARKQAAGPLYFGGASDPGLGGGGTVLRGSRAPGFTQAYRLIEEHHRLAQPGFGSIQGFILALHVSSCSTSVCQFCQSCRSQWSPAKRSEKKRAGGHLLISAIMTPLASTAIIAALSMTSYFSTHRATRGAP